MPPMPTTGSMTTKVTMASTQSMSPYTSHDLVAGLTLIPATATTVIKASMASMPSMSPKSCSPLTSIYRESH